MSDNRSESARQSKNQKRADARDKARQLRAEHRKKERRTRLLVGGGIALAAVAVIAVIAGTLAASVRPDGPGPRNMASDGIRIGEGFVVVPTPALAADARPVISEPNPDGVVDIQIVVDYLCATCGEFEAENADLIRTLIESGAATVEYRPVAFLTSQSVGTRYSLRAANAAACVANSSPDSFFSFHDRLFDQQPEQGTAGLDDAQLITIASAAGATLSTVQECITDLSFESWVRAATDRAQNGPLAIRNVEVEGIEGTPTIFVNGEVYEYSYPFDQSEFSQFVLQAAGDEFSTNPSPTPTPTP
jgi:protein-disulfide isomerase